MTTLADLLAGASEQEIDDFICRHDPGAWAERKRGFENAGFHDEWYALLTRAQRLAVVAPREHAKTEVFTVNATAWRSIYFPGIWTYVFAATGDLAAELKARIDTAIEEVDPWLVQGARRKARYGSTYANGSRLTVAGAGKAVRGAHPDIIIGDDVLEESGCMTEHQRKKTARWWFGTVANMAHPGTTRVVRPVGAKTYRGRFTATRTFLVGTPFHQLDLIMGMRNNPLYQFRRYAAEATPEQMVAGTYAVEIRRAA